MAKDTRKKALAKKAASGLRKKLGTKLAPSEEAKLEKLSEKKLERLLSSLTPPTRAEALDPALRARARGVFEKFYKPAAKPKALLLRNPSCLEIGVLVVGGGAGAFLAPFVKGSPLADPLHGFTGCGFELGTLESGATISIRFGALGPDPFEGPTGTGMLAVHLSTSPAVIYAEGTIESPADIDEIVLEKARGQLFLYGSDTLFNRAGDRGTRVPGTLSPAKAMQQIAKPLLQWAANPKNVQSD